MYGVQVQDLIKLLFILPVYIFYDKMKNKPVQSTLHGYENILGHAGVEQGNLSGLNAIIIGVFTLNDFVLS